MAITPTSEIYLLNVPFEKDYKNVVYWTSRAQQRDTLLGLSKKALSNYTYQRKDNAIRCGEHIDTLTNYNYVMYCNHMGNSKWYYAFITKMEYVNDGCTLIYIETDVYNTYCFDVTVQQSFIEREHTNNDTAGANTIPEGLETGEYVCTGSNVLTELNESFYYVLAHTVNEQGDAVEGNVYGSVYSGAKYSPFTNATNLTNALNGFDRDGAGESVIAIFIVPSFMVSVTGNTLHIPDGQAGFNYSMSMQAFKKLHNGYVPKNNKLLTYPYIYLNASNGQGSNAIYHIEKFKGEQSSAGDGEEISFKIIGVPTPGCSIRMFPKNYNGVKDNFDEGLNLGKLPICSWQSDAYTNWLTQNAVNIASDIGTGVLQIAGGVGTMIGTGGIGSFYGGMSAYNGAMQIVSTLGQVYQHSLVPDQFKGNINCGDVAFASKFATFAFYTMTIKEEYARIIDNFFSMYGYKTNRVKIPFSGHRSRWWYTKTIDVNIDGKIPADDMEKYKHIYNTGVTFWRNLNEIGFYSGKDGLIYDNPIV